MKQFNEIVKDLDISDIRIESDKEFCIKTGDKIKVYWKDEPIWGIERIKILCDASLNINRVVIWYNEKSKKKTDNVLVTNTVHHCKMIIGIPNIDIYLKNIRIYSESNTDEVEAMRGTKITDKRGEELNSIVKYELDIGDSSCITEITLISC